MERKQSPEERFEYSFGVTLYLALWRERNLIYDFPPESKILGI